LEIAVENAFNNEFGVRLAVNGLRLDHGQGNRKATRRTVTDAKIRELVKAGTQKIKHFSLGYPTKDAMHFRFKGGGRKMSIARSTMKQEAARLHDAVVQEERKRAEFYSFPRF
jgi:hypothetical protein